MPATLFQHERRISMAARLLNALLILLDRKNSLSRRIRKGIDNPPPAPLPKSMHRVAQVNESEFMGRPLWILEPLDLVKRTIFYLHGGGYVSNMHKVHWGYIKDMIQANPGTRVIVPDYPLAPSTKATGVQDYLKALYHKYLDGIASDELVLMGDSAGGSLVLVMAAWMRDTLHRIPRSIISLSPALNGNLKMFWEQYEAFPDYFINAQGVWDAVQTYRGDLSADDPIISPINLSYEGLPPIHLFMGTSEILLQDSDALWVRAKERQYDLSYYRFRGMQHVWPLFGVLPEAKVAREMIWKAIRA